MRIHWRFWLGSAAALTALGGLALALDPHPAGQLVTPIWVTVIWGILLLGWRGAARSATGIRIRGIGLAFVLLGAVTLAGVGGLIVFQPMRSAPPGASYAAFVLALAWIVIFAIGFNTNAERLRTFGQKVANSRFSGLLMVCVGVVVALTAAEWGLRFFAIQSYGATPSILTGNYVRLTWGEVNALGFRDDREPVPPADEATQVLIVVGDSVAAGFGVDERADRFPDRLQTQFGDALAVYLVAKPGWESQTQFQALQDYPVSPDIVVVSYYINDVSDAYEDVVEPFMPADRGNFLANKLFVASFLYWNVLLDEENVFDATLASQQNELVLAAHAGEIREMIDWARGQGAAVAYVVWPSLVEPDKYAPLLDTVRSVLTEADVPYVDMQPLIEPYPVVERIATVYDPHPSVTMHALAAEALANLLVENDILPPE